MTSRIASMGRRTQRVLSRGFRALLPASVFALALAAAPAARAAANVAPRTAWNAAPRGPEQADSIAAALARTPADRRWAAWDERRRAAERGLLHFAADTLGEDLLFAVQDFGSQSIELRLVEAASWRRVVARYERASPADLRLLQRVVLGRVRPLYEQRPARVAALWFEEMGSSAPHSLWVAPVDSIAYATPELHRTTVISFSHDNGSGLRVLARDGEVLVETLADQWPGSSGVDTWLCNACPHLSQRSTWRLTATGALLLRVQPVDDAAFAVARAFDARHGYRAWPDHDVVVAADVDGWMRARTWAVLMDVMPRGDGGARVAIFSRGRGDSLGLEVRRPQGAAGAWRIDAAR